MSAVAADVELDEGAEAGGGKKKVIKAAQKTLSSEVRGRYDGDVLQVYFTQFVMQ